MAQTELAWGAGPGPDYDALAARFRPIFAEIGEGAVRGESSTASFPKRRSGS